MASLTNQKIKDTYEGLLKTSDNEAIDGAVEITDGAGNSTGVTISNDGQVTATGTVSFGSLKDTGEDITVTKFVDEADGIGNNDNDTTIPTSAAVKDYVDTNVTAQDLDFQGDSGIGAVDLDSQSLDVSGAPNQIETSASGQTLTVGLVASPTVSGTITGGTLTDGTATLTGGNLTGSVTGNVTGDITGDVTGDLTGNVTGNVTGNITGNVTGDLTGDVTGDVTGDLTGNVTATSVLADGVTATTQALNDNSTKVATTAYVDAKVTAEDLDFQGDTGTGSVDLDTESLDIAGGTGIDTTASGQTLTVNIDSTVATLSDTQTLTNKTIDADDNTISNLETDNLKSGVLDTDLSSVSASDDTLASAKAIKTYVDTQITAEDLDFSGNTGTGSVDLDSETFAITGSNGITTTGANQGLVIDGSTLQSDISTNSSNISTNTTNIASNATDIATNTTNISTNATNISSNDTDIAANATAIATNTSNISTNATNIASNDTDISALQTDVSTNTTNISTNATNIASNDTDISALQTDVSTNTTNISTNATNIASNDTDIATNASNISTNTTNISTNATNIASNDTDIATNAGNISTNTSNISTNTSNISTNTSNISSNTTAIAGKVAKAGDTMTGGLVIDKLNNQLVIENDYGEVLRVNDLSTKIGDIDAASGEGYLDISDTKTSYLVGTDERVRISDDADVTLYGYSTNNATGAELNIRKGQSNEVEGNVKVNYATFPDSHLQLQYQDPANANEINLYGEHTYFNNPLRIGSNAEANELDDYEEGTYNLKFYLGTSSTAYDGSNGFSTFTNNSKYVKVGRKVTLYIKLQYTGVSNAIQLSTSRISLGNFPFTPLSSEQIHGTYGFNYMERAGSTTIPAEYGWNGIIQPSYFGAAFSGKASFQRLEYVGTISSWSQLGIYGTMFPRYGPFGSANTLAGIIHYYTNN